jgi:hypothetical protein
MSELGQQRRFSGDRDMSASPPTPDVSLRCRERSSRARSSLWRGALTGHSVWSAALDPISATCLASRRKSCRQFCLSLHPATAESSIRALNLII